MVELKSFLPSLLPYVMGCSEPLAIQALRDSAIEFCRRSLVVTTTLDPITVTQNTASYELEAPDQTVIEQVLKVWFEGKLLGAAPFEAATELYGPAGSPRHFFGQDIDEVFSLTLLPTPDKTVRNSLRVRVALSPSRSATTVHDVLYERYEEGIVAGAKGILMAVPDQPFSDFNMAGAQAMQARAFANHARFDSTHGRVQSSLSVRMRAF